MMKVENGKITYIDTDSGHYKPTQENLYSIVKILQNVIADDAIIVSQSFSYDQNTSQLHSQDHMENKEQFLQRMETKGKDGLTIPERYFGELRKYNETYKNKLNDSKSSHIETVLQKRQNAVNPSDKGIILK